MTTRMYSKKFLDFTKSVTKQVNLRKQLNSLPFWSPHLLAEDNISLITALGQCEDHRKYCMSKYFKMVKCNTMLIIIQRLSKGTFKGTSKKTCPPSYYISYYLSETHKYTIRDLYGSDFFFFLRIQESLLHSNLWRIISLVILNNSVRIN